MEREDTYGRPAGRAGLYLVKDLVIAVVAQLHHIAPARLGWVRPLRPGSRLRRAGPGVRCARLARGSGPRPLLAGRDGAARRGHPLCVRLRLDARRGPVLLLRQKAPQLPGLWALRAAGRRSHDRRWHRRQRGRADRYLGGGARPGGRRARGSCDAAGGRRPRRRDLRRPLAATPPIVEPEDSRL